MPTTTPKDYYGALGAKKNASQDEIRKAFLDTAGQAAMLSADDVAQVALPLVLPGCACTGEAIDL